MDTLIQPSGVTIDMTKEKQNAPSVEITVEKTSGSIKVINPTGNMYQYSINGTDWNTSGEFTNLEAGKTYTVYVRYPKNTNYSASEAVEKIVITANEDGSAAVKPGETLVTENGTVTNDGGNITVEDHNGNISTVTPAPNGGIPVNYLIQYNDVPADAWYTEAVRWATCAESAAMLTRFLELDK